MEKEERKLPMFLDAKALAASLGSNVLEANALLDRADFPTIELFGRKMVLDSCLEKWAEEHSRKGSEPKPEEQVYNTKDLAFILKCSIPSAREIMYRHDFPLIKIGKGLRVTKKAFEEWAMRSGACCR